MKTSKSMMLLVGFLTISTMLLAQPETNIETTKMSETLYHFKVTTFYPVSTLASIGPDGILLVDPGMEQSNTELMKVLAELSDLKVTKVINTHSHDHHTSMNKYFGETAEIVGHAASIDLMRSDLDVLVEWPQKAFPSWSIESDTSFVFNGEEIRLIPVTGGHCKDDLLVYFPDSKVACTGGVLKSGSYPMVDFARGGDFRGFPELADKALSIFPRDVTFVQSHGDNFDYTQASEYVKRLDRSIPLIKKAVASGKTPQEMIDENILSVLADDDHAYPNRRFWIQTIHRGLTMKNNGVKKSLTAPIYHALMNGNGTDAVKTYRELKKSNPEEFGFNENVLNVLGYYLLGKDRLDDAIIIFKLNVKEYPRSFNVYDSLGEGYMNRGNLWRAKRNYKKSIRINPENQNGIDMLEKLATL
ncbi:MAG: MBL fold metallo-hydrolase [Candidatus Marinimicrobia bacterium]|nr:MBL fold metallo-hydrolase [Candidatus Neomarinimicrobiota bacterium]MBT4362474.1 MBL fold metallo-hydrolase [Candidatus Neomarinimicrobiota bacterium]MBT4714523.1 MBL fold metallo-hydrolase [Candidatus Neomarinimicrobiota bacterium]MBT4946562.1 MBL fold metallo-hydrolase [Candidatus Neomarinimicrobiota bacterium]MBT5270359.1 MBL fold metallo-hydrolase [Candidatus Neomarinimicrobiota bacterium]